MDTGNELSDIPPKTTEKLINEIQSIVLLEKSVVTTDNENPPQCNLATEQYDDNSDNTASEDENENTLNARSETFYKDAQQYWKAIPATVDGMLGGFASINFTDIRGSQDFLNKVFKMKPSPNKNVALDCGAGMMFAMDCLFHYHSLNR